MVARKKAGLDDGPPKPKKLSKKAKEKQDRELAALLGLPMPRKEKKKKKEKAEEPPPEDEEEEEEEEDDWAKLPDAADLAKLAPAPVPAPAPASAAGGSGRAEEAVEPEELTYEEELELRRTNLLRKFDRSELTPITFLSFMVWKSGRDEARRKAYEEADLAEAKRLGIKKNMDAKSALHADPSIFVRGASSSSAGGEEDDAADEDLVFAAEAAESAELAAAATGGSGPGGMMTLEEQFKAMLDGNSGDGDAMTRRAKTMAARAMTMHA